MGTTNIRFSGLASGLDTESLVNAMIMPYKNKVDTTTQQKKLLELKKDAWKEMNNKLNTFYTKVLDPMRLEGSFNKTKVTVSNENAIEIDKNISVPEGTHSFKIESLATGATASSSTIKADKATKLNALGITSGTAISINDKSVTIKDDMTIEEFEKEMQTQLEGTGVKFRFDTNVSAFVVTTSATGKEQEINIVATGGSGDSALNKLGFVPKKDETGKESYSYSGTNAEVIYNEGITITSATNNIEVNGLKISLKGQSSDVITIGSVKDSDAIVDFVKNFVTEYNTLIEHMNELIDAPRNNDYMPLTDEQKADMTESDIKLWEEKINKSLLSNDSTLKELTSSMRNILGQKVEGNTFGSLYDLGITTGNWKENGKLYLDEEKLRAAINKDSDAVVQLLAGNGSAKQLYESQNKDAKWEDLSSEEQKKYADDTADRRLGLGDRLYESMRDKLKGSTLKSANSFFNDKVLDKQISTYKTKVTSLEDRLTRMETLYYSKFTAMEKALSSLNNQSSWLSGQLGGM